MERHGHLSLSDKTRAHLLELSAATADRIFRQFRVDHRPHGKTTTKSGQLLKHRVPIRTFTDWADTRPGFMESDLVAHCGANSEGPFLHTLVLTDVATGWTECLALLRRTEADILQALTTARQILPFQLVGLDTDNGSEFMNYGLLAYCERETIQFTRGRARRKNDQCFVEQKNGSIVRQLVGYDRYEGSLAYRQLAELYRVVRFYVNFFQPSMKLKTRTRDGSQVTKRYDIAQTPYQRLSNSDALDPEVRDRLSAIYERLDPVDLRRQLEKLQDAFWRHARERLSSTLTDEVVRVIFSAGGVHEQRGITYQRGITCRGGGLAKKHPLSIGPYERREERGSSGLARTRRCDPRKMGFHQTRFHFASHQRASGGGGHAINFSP